MDIEESPLAAVQHGNLTGLLPHGKAAKKERRPVAARKTLRPASFCCTPGIKALHNPWISLPTKKRRVQSSLICFPPTRALICTKLFGFLPIRLGGTLSPYLGLVLGTLFGPGPGDYLTVWSASGLSLGLALKADVCGTHMSFSFD